MALSNSAGMAHFVAQDVNPGVNAVIRTYYECPRYGIFLNTLIFKFFNESIPKNVPGLRPSRMRG